MSDEERSTRKVHEMPAWAGSRGELQRIGKTVEELVTARRATLISESDQQRPKPAEPTHLQLPDGQTIEIPPSTSPEMILWQVERDNIEREMITRGTLVDGDDKLTGAVDTAFSELDGRTVKTLKFFGGTSYKDGIEVEFSRDTGDAAVKVTVISPDQGWARQSFVRLTEEVKKGVPRWAWIRKRFGHGIVSLCTGLVAGIALGLAVYPYLPSKDRSAFLVPIVFYSVVVVVFIVLFSRMYGWFFPSFEVIAEGGQSSGSRRIGLIVGIVLLVPVGIVVNHLG